MMLDQPVIRVCLIIGSLITAGYILQRVSTAKVQIEDTIFWLLFSGVLLIVAVFLRVRMMLAAWRGVRFTLPVLGRRLEKFVG